MKRFLTVMTVFFISACATIDELPSFAASGTAARKPVLINEGRILEKLGEPTLKRREDPAEVWVYSREKCVLFIYMNETGTQNARVTHMEIGKPSKTAAQKESRACLKMASRLL